MDSVKRDWEGENQELAEQIELAEEKLIALLENISFVASKILSSQDLAEQLAKSGVDFADIMKDWVKKGNLMALSRWYEFNLPREGQTDLCRLVGLYLTLKEQENGSVQ